VFGVWGSSRATCAFQLPSSAAPAPQELRIGLRPARERWAKHVSVREQERQVPANLQATRNNLQATRNVGVATGTGTSVGVLSPKKREGKSTLQG
jgi:hypothetical protein